MATRRDPLLGRKLDRLFWRAGFGLSIAERDRFRRDGIDAAVKYLLNPASPNAFAGRAGTIDGGRLQPFDEYGHDVAWWLDRMIRTRAPLVERMTLNLHDHFATSNEKVGDSRLMIAQYRLLRRHALGNFRDLTLSMLDDHAMQWWLDMIGSTKEDPNENFARELMELFTLGVGNYTEADVREAARAFTGYDFLWDDKRYVWNADAHDNGVKTVFGQRGRFGPAAVVDLCLGHPAHAPFLCRSLWEYFVPTAPAGPVLRNMVRAYRRSRFEIKPVLNLILRSKAFYANLGDPDLVKPPIVYVAGTMRATGSPIRSMYPVWAVANAGQTPFSPPNVAGWDQNDAFLSTLTLKARSGFVAGLLGTDRMAIAEDAVPTDETPAQALYWARRSVGFPWTSRATARRLLQLATDIQPEGGWDNHYRVERRRVLQHLLLAGPDGQVH